MLFFRIEVFLSSHCGEFQSICICPGIHGPPAANKINRKCKYKDNLKKRKTKQTK